MEMGIDVMANAGNLLSGTPDRIGIRLSAPKTRNFIIGALESDAVCRNPTFGTLEPEPKTLNLTDQDTGS